VSASIPIVLHQWVGGWVGGEYADDVLHVSMRNGVVMRGGRRVKLDRAARSILVALCAHPGRNFTRDELIEAGWGDDPRGGPENIEKRVEICCQEIRVAAPALGLVFSRDMKFTRVRPIKWEQAQ
jgi:hypothetical protein